MCSFKFEIEGKGVDIEGAVTWMTLSFPCAMIVHCVSATGIKGIHMSSLAMLEMAQISMRSSRNTEFSLCLDKLLKNRSVYLIIPFSAMHFIDLSFLRLRNDDASWVLAFRVWVAIIIVLEPLWALRRCRSCWPTRIWQLSLLARSNVRHILLSFLSTSLTSSHRHRPGRILRRVFLQFRLLWNGGQRNALSPLKLRVHSPPFLVQACQIW